ncbi:MAG: hypothetical protein PHT84_05855 [Candidatus Pacebacteria bacterium]|nr:hypothetical protein [Candidatus Paceibacterota bacterium]
MVVKTIEVENLLKKEVSTKKNGEDDCSSNLGQPNQDEKTLNDVFTAFEHEEENENPYPSKR